MKDAWVMLWYFRQMTHFMKVGNIFPYSVFPYSEFAGYFWKVMTCHGVSKVFTGSKREFRHFIKDDESINVKLRIIDRCSISGAKSTLGQSDFTFDYYMGWN